MHQYAILVTRELEDGSASFAHGEFRVTFHIWPGEGALPLIEGVPWIFVDWTLPAQSGLDLCRRLRADPATAEAHITIVVADDAEQKRHSLRAGADDYIIGPINRRLILDRLLSLRPQPESRARQILRDGDLIVDLAAFQARWKDRAIALRPSEFRLLRVFAECPGQVFTRGQLIDALGKHDASCDERTVDVWVGRLRRALRAAGAEDRLRTVRRLGYVFDRA